jgi:hypothetical protein
VRGEVPALRGTATLIAPFTKLALIEFAAAISCSSTEMMPWRPRAASSSRI